MIVMPADHVIEPPEAFRATVLAAVSVVDQDPSALVTFGIKPTHPETGYGYIERGRCWKPAAESPSTKWFSSARSPTGRPPSSSSPQAISPGTPASSSGAPRRSSTSSRTHRPNLARGSRADPSSRWALRKRPRLLARLFPSLERIPIDKAVMEKAPSRAGARGPLSLE